MAFSARIVVLSMNLKLFFVHLAEIQSVSPLARIAVPPLILTLISVKPADTISEQMSAPSVAPLLQVRRLSVLNVVALAVALFVLFAVR